MTASSVLTATPTAPGQDAGLAACMLTWADDGPAVINGAGPARPGRAGEQLPLYLKPTLVELTTAGRVRDRRDARLTFAFGEDGELITYHAAVPQDDLFRLLAAAGLLQREVIA